MRFLTLGPQLKLGMKAIINSSIDQTESSTDIQVFVCVF